jgi:hypothetical protein
MGRMAKMPHSDSQVPYTWFQLLVTLIFEQDTLAYICSGESNCKSHIYTSNAPHLNSVRPPNSSSSKLQVTLGPISCISCPHHPYLTMSDHKIEDPKEPNTEGHAQWITMRIHNHLSGTVLVQNAHLD